MTIRNEWIDRYARVNSLEVIRTSSRQEGKPLHNLDSMPTGVACARMQAELEEIFVPTARSCEIILDVVQAALAHAERHYPNREMFLANAYTKKLTFKPVVPIILTGPAGTGKSEIGKAIERLLGPSREIHIGHGHGNFPLVAVSRIAVQAEDTVASVLRMLTDPSYSREQGKLCGKGLEEGTSKWQYVTGACLTILDELQFFTQSENANTMIAKLMLRMTFVGPPVLIICNYSLGHRIMRRPHEEKHRLLTNSRILLPDPPDSSDWLGVLEAVEKVVPGIFAFSFAKQRKDLWAFCAGLKRVLVELLILAYRRARNGKRIAATWSDVVSAYSSSTFFPSRQDVESLIRQAIDGTALPSHLQCPFPIPKSEFEGYGQALSSARQHAVAEAVRESVLNKNEREIVENARRAQSGKEAGTAAGSTKQAAKKNGSAASATDLIANAKRLRANK